MEAVAEANALSSAGDSLEVDELFRYAHDLLDIMNDGADGSAEALAYIDKLRRMLWTMWNAAAETPRLH